MSAPEQDRNGHRRLVEQIRSDFDRLRWGADPIGAQLVHLGTNAHAEGVQGHPSPDASSVIAGEGAGHRQSRQLFDDEGRPRFRADPLVDAEGTPIVNSAGEAFDVVMPAFRDVTFTGEVKDFQLLRGVADRAGRVLLMLSHLPVMAFTKGWRFSTPQELWWTFLFELAISGKHPLLHAERRLWLPADNPRTFVPYDLEQLRALAASPFNLAQGIPEKWLERLPDAWMSEMTNVVMASFDAADWLFNEIMHGPEAHDLAPEKGSEEVASHSTVNTEMRRRFAIALSFPGEHRELVNAVAQKLSEAFGQHRIFYDKFYEAELAVPNVDLLLQNFYEKQADLVVVFVCKDYERKEWPRLEWSSIRSVIKNRREEDVMLLRLDDAPLDGMLPVHGYADIADRSEREIADLILQRWTSAR